MSRKWLSGAAVLAAILLVVASAAAQVDKVPPKGGVPGGVKGGVPSGVKGGGAAPGDKMMPPDGDKPGHWHEQTPPKGEQKLTEDEELKMYALNGLRQASAQEAVPLLEKFLQKNESITLKAKALQVLASFETAPARELLVKIARDGSQPELQLRAIRYLGNADSAEARKALTEIYATSTSADAKKTVLKALHNSEDRAAIRSVATSDNDPEMRSYAIRLLGSMDAREDLGALYGVEKSADVKVQILRAMSAAGDATRLAQIAGNEPDAKLRREAVRRYAATDDSKAAETLVVLYAKEKDTDVKKEVITSLVRNDNIKQLIAVARQETDPELKKYAVGRLAQSRSKEAGDFLAELLNK